MDFEKYPFEKLNDFLKDSKPNKDYALSNLTIGEPQFQTPQFIQDKLCEYASTLNKYPKTSGEDFLLQSMTNFIKNRFDVALEKNQLLSSFGTREVLFNFPQFLLFSKQNPCMAFTNPFYQIYEGAAKASRAKVIYMDLDKKNDFTPSLSKEQMQACHLVILNFPNNPTGKELSLKELELWAEDALKYDFVLLNDECYSDIYFNQMPPSLLQASKNIGNTDFKNILVVNSISKRSSAPGLRSGLIAGDTEILASYAKYRTYTGCASPLPLQHASASAWNDLEANKYFREIYKKNFALAKEILNIKIPNSSFYLWLEVRDDLSFCKALFEQKAIKVLAGRFLGRQGMGEGYVRIALVENPEKTKQSLLRLRDFLDSFESKNKGKEL